MAEVLERALYRHFKSTPEDPKYYVTLKRELTDEGKINIIYTPLYDFGTVVEPRDEEEFLEVVHHNDKEIGRFILIIASVISIHEVESVLQNHAENN